MIKKKVAIVTTTDYKEMLVGGKYESEEISEGLNKAGYECQIFSADKLPFVTRIAERVVRLLAKSLKKSLFISYFSLGKSVSKLALSWDPDIIISRDIFCSNYLVNKNRIFVQDVTSIISESKLQSGKINQKDYIKMKKIEEIVYRQCDFLIAKDVRLKEYLIKYRDYHDIQILYPPIPNYFFKNKSGDNYLKNKFNIDTSRKIILYNPTRLIKQKGVHIVEQLSYDFPEITFLVTFSSEKMNKQNTIAYGIIDRQKMPLVYSATDLLIVPSIQMGEHTEGISQVAIEGMLCETPVIASSVGGLKDHGKNIQLVKPEYNSFKLAISSWLGGKYPANTKKARKYAEGYLSKNYIHKYDQLIKKLIAK